MIWDNSIASNQPLDRAANATKALARHISAEVGQINSRAFRSAFAPDDAELARAVANFALAQSNGVLIPSDYLLILTCRALWAVGDERAARNLLRAKGPELHIPEAYADAIFSDTASFCLSGGVNFPRAFRFSSSVLSPQGPYWILNMQAFFALLGNSLELIIWRVLYALMKQLACFWDASRGNGTLGLKNSGLVAAQMLALPCQSKPAKKFINEIMRYCARTLELKAAERGWQSTPTIINLDV